MQASLAFYHTHWLIVLVRPHPPLLLEGLFAVSSLGNPDFYYVLVNHEWSESIPQPLVDTLPVVVAWKRPQPPVAVVVVLKLVAEKRHVNSRLNPYTLSLIRGTFSFPLLNLVLSVSIAQLKSLLPC